MNYKELRNKIYKTKAKQVIKWNKSGIVESADMKPNGALEITNFITNKSYILPKRYQELDITIFNSNDLISFYSLLPKNMRDGL